MASQFIMWMVFTAVQCILYTSVQVVHSTNATQKHISVDVLCKNNPGILCAMMYKYGACCTSFRVGGFTITLSHTGRDNTSSRFQHGAIVPDTVKTIGVQDQVTAIDCGSPIPPSTNALMMYTDTTFKSKVNVRCVNQTSFYGGNSTGECKENGKWVGISGSCLSDAELIDGWTLVFRATADIGQSMYDKWVNDNDYQDPNDMKSECISLTTSPKCDMHYKSKIIAAWGEAKIEKVKVFLLKNNAVRRELLFNGAGTRKTNWFSPSHLINSSWTGLNPSNIFASFKLKSTRSRVFDITKKWGNCQVDSWMLIVDKPYDNGCWWDSLNPTPKIIYHMNPTVTKIGDREIEAFDRGYEYGDAMAVLVKCKNSCLVQ